MNSPPSSFFHSTLPRILRWCFDPFILPHSGENPLADYSLGRNPRSRRRSNRAMLTAFAPASLYILLLAIGIIVFSRLNNEGYLEGSVWGLTLLIGQPGIAAGVLIGMPIHPRGPALLRGNWQDYSMAGFAPREILVGLAAPHLRSGMLSFICFAGTSTVFVYMTIVRLRESSLGPRNLLEDISILSLYAAVFLDFALWIPLGQVLTVALWSRPESSRVGAILLVPFTSTLAFLLSVLFSGFFPDISSVVPLAIVVTLARPAIALVIWHRTLLLLDANGP